MVPYANIAHEEANPMAVDRSHVEQNRTQRERLRALVGHLTRATHRREHLDEIEQVLRR